MYMPTEGVRFVLCDFTDGLWCGLSNKYFIADIRTLNMPTFNTITSKLNMSLAENSYCCIHFKKWIQSLLMRFVTVNK